MYVDPDYKSKKDFKAAVEKGVCHKPYNPSGMFERTSNGTGVVEGPHYPKPHKWYAQVTIENGVVTKVK